MNGHDQFIRNSLGLENASSIFQRVMDNISRELNYDICLTYLDNILTFSTSLEDHISRLEKVSRRIGKANFKIQLYNCNFLKKTVA